MEIHAIHGFLGLPTDWDQFNFQNLYAHDLTNTEIVPSTDGFWGWARRFNQKVLKDSKNNERILMGYSLGGRLAIHALLDNPSQWKAGIIISSHPGYKTESERSVCLQNDQAWAVRFENEPWDLVLQTWNAKPTFAGLEFPIIRHEDQFSRKQLAHQLRTCSRAYQDDLSKPLQNFRLPLLWICGKLDRNFVTSSKELNFVHPLSRVEIVEDAAHRVPWEQPEKFLNLIQSFKSEILSCT